MIRLVWAAATDVGQLRHQNEDSYFANGRVFVIADGMGGHAAGEVASELAVAELRALDAWVSPDPLTPQSITSAITEANERILDAAWARGDRFGMGTTLTGLAVVSVDGTEQWAVFNVGDSRVYRFAGGSLTQLTVDHSEVEELIAAGLLLPQHAATYARRNVVTRSLGSDPAPEIDLWVRSPEPGERFIICSDGLTNEVAPDEIASIAATNANTQQAADALVRRANEHGGRDNITVIVVDNLSETRSRS